MNALKDTCRLIPVYERPLKSLHERLKHLTLKLRQVLNSLNQWVSKEGPGAPGAGGVFCTKESKYFTISYKKCADLGHVSY